MDLDTIDKNILNILQNNAKITNVALAQKVNLSPAATLERVKKLEQQEIIARYYVQVNYEKLGFLVELIVGIRLKKMTTEAIQSFNSCIDKIHCVLKCYQVVGKFHYILIVQSKSISSYHEKVIEKLYQMHDIVETIQTFSVTKILKNKSIFLT